MSVWAKKIMLYVNVDAAGMGNGPLLSGKSSALLSSNPVFIQGDKARLEIYFRTPATSPLGNSTVAELPAGSQIVVAGKVPGSLDADACLFSALPFAQSGAGDDLYYFADLDLNTVEIDSLFDQLAATYAAIKVDVEIQNADNSDRLTLQFDATLRQQVYSAEPPSTPGTPAHYTATQAEDRFVPRAEDQAAVRWHDAGSGPRWWHWDPATQLWYPEILITRDGVRQIVLGEGGIEL